MRAFAPSILLALAVGYVLAHFLVLFYNQWYFAEYFWLKTLCLAPLIAAVYFALWLGRWRRLWTALGIYWLAIHLLALIPARGLALSGLNFTAMLDFEAAVVWVPALAFTFHALAAARRARVERERVLRSETAELKLRAKLRRRLAVSRRKELSEVQAESLALLVVAGALLLGGAPASAQETGQQGTLNPAGDRHRELGDPELKLGPLEPAWPNAYTTPLHLRARDVFWIVIENERDGRIYVSQQQAAGQGMAAAESAIEHELGRVLAPVANINKQGFTASGWAEPGTVCASAVNAIHLKTGHNYTDGKGVVLTLQPLEFADFDPANYGSYFNQSSSLFSDIPAGTGIFGGKWAPLVGSRLFFSRDGIGSAPVADGWVPQAGDELRIQVERRKYNPEYIEFENRYGGLIWVREIGMDPYPVGQVLKPVGGTGRFGGTLYADTGRLRAAHPGVIDVSTSKLGEIGGFQILPRDHAMSPEMDFARLKTQWMVVGPLWALDPSWEGTPPLFSDYLYPAFIPAMNDDGTPNLEVGGADAFLDRFTVRARYRDSADPAEWELLQEEPMLDNYSLRTLSHLRIYFPRG